MYNYELPYGYNKMDVVAGTVVRSSRAGIDILLDNDGSEPTEERKAFARCMGKIGQRVLVSLRYYNEDRNNFFARLDGYLDEGPGAASEESKETAGQRAVACAA